MLKAEPCSFKTFIFLVIFAQIFIIAPTVNAKERITKYDTALTVLPDGTISVTETIRVIAEGRKIKRGIYRDFPVVYTNEDGSPHRVGFKVYNVLRDGHLEPYHTKKMGRFIRVYFGDKNVYLNAGEYEYSFTYTTNRQIYFGEYENKLAYNVVGHGFEFPIDNITSSISFPEDVVIFSAEAYTGRFGSKESDASVMGVDTNWVDANATRPFQPGEGMTVIVTFNPGPVQPPTKGQIFEWFLTDHAVAVAAGLGVSILIIYFLFAWNKVGRDPKEGTIIPLFEPPKGLSPAALQYVRDRAVSAQGYTAAIISMAVKGYLTIADGDKKKSYELTRVNKDVPLYGGEKAIADNLFAEEETVSIGGEYSDRAKKAKDSFTKALKEEYEGYLFHLNRKWFGYGIAISLLALMPMVYLADEHEIFGMITIMAGMIWLFIAVIPTQVIVHSFRGVPILAGIVIVIAVFMPKNPSGLLGSFGQHLRGEHITWAITIMVITLLLLFFKHLLEAPTDVGQKVLDEINGFRDYLITADEDYLDKMTPPEKTPELFEKYLPHAIALDAQNEWSGKFTAILAAAVAAGAAYSWYGGAHMHSHTNFSALTNNLSSGLTSAMTASSTPPSSSGGGGGGSSGGGGGGGGGGGW